MAADGMRNGVAADFFHSLRRTKQPSWKELHSFCEDISTLRQIRVDRVGNAQETLNVTSEHFTPERHGWLRFDVAAVAWRSKGINIRTKRRKVAQTLPVLANLPRLDAGWRLVT